MPSSRAAAARARSSARPSSSSPSSAAVSVAASAAARRASGHPPPQPPPPPPSRPAPAVSRSSSVGEARAVSLIGTKTHSPASSARSLPRSATLARRLACRASAASDSSVLWSTIIRTPAGASVAAAARTSASDSPAVKCRNAVCFIAQSSGRPAAGREEAARSRATAPFTRRRLPQRWSTAADWASRGEERAARPRAVQTGGITSI
mmetsp:Transcript_25757/g.83846  ORF Transcript_25757/g.83846 Transcript_25757/m.83846 type:complete len:207 (+) Transcript_25757:832-1452(+)